MEIDELNGLVSSSELADRLDCSPRTVQLLAPLLPRHHLVGGRLYWTEPFAKRCEGFWREWVELPWRGRHTLLSMCGADQRRIRQLVSEGRDASELGRLLDMPMEVAVVAFRVAELAERWGKEVDPTAYQYPDKKSRYLAS